MYASFFPGQWQIVAGRDHFLLKLHLINRSKVLFGNTQAFLSQVLMLPLYTTS